ncbi:15-cis-phytoene synthase [Roseovarius indicus]|uniref:15-cis-phytoene synthase n=1 Tax=Roseovarius indicus TaxID=540747 RepID=UPI0032EAA0E9
MIDPKDMAHCAEAIRHGSRSFHAASKLLPRRLRDPALALYAFCRLADDAVDLQLAKAEAVLRLHERLDKAYAGRPENAPADRAFAAIIEAFDMPRALPEALLEGLAWDAMERRYQTLSELRAYSARVASAVGAMMCVLMRVRDADALARACDLGVAMQLTNIARDVGEDAREGRLYLPVEWLADVGLAPEDLLTDARMRPELAVLSRRLLREAEGLYAKSEAGVGVLPLDCRPGIFAARFIYAGIGAEVRRNGYDAVNHRARTNGAQKLGWLMLAGLRTAGTLVMPRSPVIHARALPETQFLVDAAAEAAQRAADWSDQLYGTLAGLKARDRAQKASLMKGVRVAR